MHATEMTAVCEAERSSIQFEGHIHVHAAFRLIRATQHFLRAAEPNELTIEAEVHREQTAIEKEKKVFAPTQDGTYFLSCRKASEMRGLLRPCGDGMKDVDTANATTLDESA